MAQLQLPPSINDLRSQSLLATIERLDALDLTPSAVLPPRLGSGFGADLSGLAIRHARSAVATCGEHLGREYRRADRHRHAHRYRHVVIVVGQRRADRLRFLASAAADLPFHCIACMARSYSISQALGSLNWTSVTFLEGQTSWGGSAWPSSEGWAVFRVVVNLGAGQTVGMNDAARIVAAVNFFKPARSWLDALVFEAAPLGDAAPAPATSPARSTTHPRRAIC